MATAGALALLAAPAYAQSQWQDERDWRSQDRAQYDDRYSYPDQRRASGGERSARRWQDERAMRWRDARSGDAWRYERPYSMRERERLYWNESDRYSERDARRFSRDRNRDERNAGVPSYPRDFYAGRGADQFQGRQYMPPGFDYYDYYGAERPSNRPDYSDRRAMDEGQGDRSRWDRSRMQAEREWRDRDMAEREWRDREMAGRTPGWREDYRRWARGQRDLYDGRYRLPDYDGDFAGSTGVGMGDMTGRGVGMPDYYQGESGGAFHHDPRRWANIMRSQRSAERDFRDEMAQSVEQQDGSTRRGGPPVARAVAGSDRDEPSADTQPNIPGQSQGSVGHPRSAQTTGQGQGVMETNTSEVKQPETQIPEQSLGTVGHPGERETTGQGSGVAEQPAGNENGSTDSR